MTLGLPSEATRAPAPAAAGRPTGEPKRRVAYIVSRFPEVTETFILREFDRVDASPAIDVELFSLFPGEREAIHDAAQRWMSRLRRGRLRDAVVGTAWWALRRPGRLVSTTAIVIAEHAARPRILVRALVTVPLAAGHARTMVKSGVSHAHGSWATYPALAAWVAWRLTGIPYSFTGHAHDLFIHQLGLRRKLRDARFAVTISEHNRSFLASHGADVGRLHIVHCGVDPAAYRFRPRGPRAAGPVRLLCVASFTEYKGHRVLIEALAPGGSEIDRVQLDLVGDGPLRREIEELAASRGVAHRLRFHGWLSERQVAERLDEADVLVLPSIVASNGDTEGVPNALIEAMACGVPVVSTRVSGIPELVRDGETGLLADPDDPAGLRDAIERTLADPAAAETRAVAGRHLVEREFNLDTMTQQLTRLFLHEDGEEIRP